MQLFYLYLLSTAFANGFLLYNFLKFVKNRIGVAPRKNNLISNTYNNNKEIAKQIARETEEAIYNAMKTRMQYKMFRYYNQMENHTIIDTEIYDDDDGCGCGILDDFSEVKNITQK